MRQPQNSNAPTIKFRRRANKAAAFLQATLLWDRITWMKHDINFCKWYKESNVRGIHACSSVFRDSLHENSSQRQKIMANSWKATNKNNSLPRCFIRCPIVLRKKNMFLFSASMDSFFFVPLGCHSKNSFSILRSASKCSSFAWQCFVLHVAKSKLAVFWTKWFKRDKWNFTIFKRVSKVARRPTTPTPLLRCEGLKTSELFDLLKSWNHIVAADKKCTRLSEKELHLAWRRTACKASKHFESFFWYVLLKNMFGSGQRMAGRQREADWLGFDAVRSIGERGIPCSSKRCSTAHFVPLLDRRGIKKHRSPGQQQRTKRAFCFLLMNRWSTSGQPLLFLTLCSKMFAWLCLFGDFPAKKPSIIPNSWWIVFSIGEWFCWHPISPEPAWYVQVVVSTYVKPK